MIVFALFFSCTAMAEEQSDEDFCKEAALNLAAELDAFAADEALMAVFTSSSELAETAAGYAACALHETGDVRVLNFDMNNFFTGMLPREADLNEEQTALFLRKVSSASILSMVNSCSGAIELAITNNCMFSRSYAVDLGGMGYLAVISKDDCDTAIGCVIEPTGDGVVTATAAYIASMSALKAFFNDYSSILK